jgi:hypothetical protein
MWTQLPGIGHCFLGADSGGERAAAMYALIGTARLNGSDPEAYLRYVFTHIADYTPSIALQTSCHGASPAVSNKTQHKSHGRIGLEKSMTVLMGAYTLIVPNALLLYARQ